MEETISKTKMVIEAQTGINNIYNKYASRLNQQAKTITSQKELDNLIESSRKDASKEADKLIKDLEGKYKGEYDKRERKRVIDYVKLETSQKFWQHRIQNLMRLGLYSIPIYGKALFATDIAKGPGEIKKTVSFVREYPELRGTIYKEAGATAATFLIGGLAIKGTKTALNQKKVASAIQAGKVKVESAGILTESQISALKISAGQKAQLMTILKKGGSVKAYKTKMEYALKTKYSPNIEGQFIEAIDVTGKIVQRLSVGKLTATLGGKQIDKLSMTQAIFKIEGKTKAKGYSEVILVTPKKGIDLITGRQIEKLKKPKISAFYEEVTLLKTKQKGPIRITKTAAGSELLYTKKYKGEPLVFEKFGTTKEGIVVLPDYSKLKGTGVSFTQARFTEVIGLQKIKGEIIAPKGVGIFKGTKTYVTYGKGVVEPYKPLIGYTTPKTPLLKSFQTADVFTKVPKPKKVPGVPIKDYSPRDVSTLTLEGIPKSEWYGKSFLVPIIDTPTTVFAGELATTVFAGELATTFAPVSTGLISGVGLGLGMGIGTAVRTIVKPEVKTSELLLGKTKTIEVTKEKEKVAVTPISDFMLLTVPIEKQVPTERVSLKQPQLFKQVQKFTKKQVVVQPIPTTFASVMFPAEAFKFRFAFEGPEKKVITKEEPYDAHAYIDATKKKEAYWKKLNIKPLTKISAVSMASEYVDLNISARGKVTKVKPTLRKGKKVMPKEVIDTGNRYWDINRHKFRTFQQKGGIRTKLPNQFIELQKFRIDSPGERRTLKVERQKKRRTPFGF